MQLKKHTNTTQSLTSLFPIHSVSIILDKSFEFVNQLENQDFINSKSVTLITIEELSLIVPYLNITQNIGLTSKKQLKKTYKTISKLIYGQYFHHYSPNFINKKTTDLSHFDETLILIFRAILNDYSVIILSGLIDEFSIIETRFFIDLVTELTCQLDLSIIITTKQTELLTQPQIIPFTESPIIK
ncbi:hypothetical protein ACE83Q_00960 [Dellaglioa sp. P0083]|uniref:hypothetical protein n=1 Tax=Dellaglioa kimchii TaxID=3344667 RepID=UPI0038D42D93